jgi:hypothetical protein
MQPLSSSAKLSIYPPHTDNLQLIKKLSATPVIHAQDLTNAGSGLADSQASLQANKATFFFRLVR